MIESTIDIQKLVESVFDDAVRLRKQFHEYPELGYHEFETSKTIETYLKELGLEVQN